MNKRIVYDFFIGLLALMLALMLFIEVFIAIPAEVKITFYYIDNIVRLIFIGDFVFRLVFAKVKIQFLKSNVIDLISIVPVKMYVTLAAMVRMGYLIEPSIIVKGVKLWVIAILYIKFKKKTREEIRKNKVYYLLIICTIIIVIGAVIISLIEGISLGDALWWSFVTFTTVGYGDVTLKTQLGRGIAVILMLFGVGFIGVTSTAIALYIIDVGKGKKDNSYKNKVLEGIKIMLDNYDSLTDEDIDNIVKILKSLRDKQ